MESIRTGMIPIINAMAAAGIVSLPGMMTGQILSGTAPVEAVKKGLLLDLTGLLLLAFLVYVYWPLLTSFAVVGA